MEDYVIEEEIFLTLKIKGEVYFASVFLLWGGVTLIDEDEEVEFYYPPENVWFQ